MRLIFLFSLMVLVQTTSSGQTSPPISEYFDKEWETVTDPAKAAYYRTIEQNANGFVVRDYFISGKLQMVAECSNVSPSLEREGKSIFYYENGNVKEEGFYHENRETGVQKSYYENGKPKMEKAYEKDDTRYLHYWNERDEDELADGEGVISEYADEEFINYRSIFDFKMVDAFSVSRTSGDTVYTVVEQQPEYPGGYTRMMTDLQQSMHYPKSARRRGIAGTVYVGFIVEKNGSVSNVKVIRGIDPECDEVAIDAVKKLQKWNPGMQKKNFPGAVARPVAVRFVLPLKFKLR